MHTKNYVAVIDLGSQTTMLIARRIRELGVLAKVLPPNTLARDLKENLPDALILSGGPESLKNADALRIDPELFSLSVPILGICYGMQLIAEHFFGVITNAHVKEFGRRNIEVNDECVLFHGVKKQSIVWMSHADQIALNDNNFRTIAKSESCPQAAIEWLEKRIYGLQFHPEVTHTEQGETIFRNFLFKVAGARANFDLKSALDTKIEEIKAQVGGAHVIMGLSGGVDSTVAAFLIHRAIQDRLHCVYVNHGLHREGEIEEIKNLTSSLGIDLHIIDAREQFFSALSGVVDPEEKRKCIGRTFVEVFENEAKRHSSIEFLGQGTLYPDVIESPCKKSGPSHAIKSHHNVGGLPERMSLKLLEPFRDLFKDEVRKLGAMLSIPNSVLMRQPFPGPGLAVRIPGEVTKERVSLLRHADAIVREEIALWHGVKKSLWQWFAILLPVKSVGVMGDGRLYGEVIVIRCVESTDAMTADWAKLPHELLQKMSTRITNEVSGICRVLYDITQKPPGTIEWE